MGVIEQEDLCGQLGRAAATCYRRLLDEEGREPAQGRREIISSMMAGFRSPRLDDYDREHLAAVVGRAIDGVDEERARR